MLGGWKDGSAILLKNNSNSYDLVITINQEQATILKAIGIECDGLHDGSNELLERSVENRIKEICEENKYYSFETPKEEIEGQQIQRDQQLEYEDSITFSRLASNYEFN